MRFIDGMEGFAEIEKGDLIAESERDFYVRDGDNVYIANRPLCSLDPNTHIAPVSLEGTTDNEFYKEFPWQNYDPTLNDELIRAYAKDTPKK